MTKALMILTYIRNQHDIADSKIKHDREGTLNIMRQLVIEMDNHDEETRVLENRYDAINREEYSIGLASSST